MPQWEFCRQLDNATIHSSHRDRKAKAIAEVLSMIDADLPLAPHRPRPVLEADERLFETAAEFCAALEKYASDRRQRVQKGRVSSAPAGSRRVTIDVSLRSTPNRQLSIPSSHRNAVRARRKRRPASSRRLRPRARPI